MTPFIFLVGFALGAVSATSPIRNETDYSPVPIPKPVVSVPRRCPANEVLKSKFSCPPDTCDTLWLSFLCVANQTESLVCTCKDGYLRTNSSANGVCVPQDRCLPPECADDPNAQRGCGIRCKRTCADYNDTNKLCPPAACNLFGCDCKEGFVFDENIQKCVKPEKCTKKCKKPHERYSNCLLGECVPKKCADVGHPVACPDIIGPCAGGCTCEEGYVRDCQGNCIAMKDCPCCGGDPNAVSGCGNPCGKTCESLYANTSDLVCPQYCEYNGCDCKPGYRLLNANTESKKCVPERDCPKPPQKCGVNEEYYCGTSCREATCANPAPPRCVNKKCKLGCFCKKGFVRDANNKCVPVDKCAPQCQGPFEQYISCPAGQCTPKTCDDLINPPPCPRIIPPCPGGCICQDGYLRNSKGICIKKEQCPPQCKGPYEQYISCPAGECTPKTCDDLINPPPCPEVIPPCSGGCICQEGYLRNSKGICIKKEQCPKQCNKPHERYSNCLLGECVPKKCADVGHPVACPDIIGPCAGGCTCEEGYVRDCKGNCIAMKDCPCCGGDPNAVSGCGNPCGKTCESLYANTSDLVCPQYCEYNGCDCKPGYRLLNANTESKKCVPERDCPKPPQRCGVNEEYYCGTSCPEASCANPAPPKCFNKKCKLGCFCKKGFVRDANNKCVPVDKCPPQCKGPFEQYISCPAGQCTPKTCDDLINPPPCPRIIPPCPGGCVCQEGYLRNSKGICVKKEQCPSQCKGPHERYISCPPGQCIPKTCDDLITPPGCPRVIPPCLGGCICEEGYLRGPQGICIKQEDCPKGTCSANQTYVNCNANCPDKHCPKDDKPQPVCDPPRNCPPGCTCKINYRYDQSGKCILASECPQVNCTGPNTEWNSCPSACLSERCEDADSPPVVCNTLLLNCQPQCVCKQGHFRNVDGVCIPAKECPSVCKDPNASWKDCKDACPATCQNTKPACVNKKCSVGCQCNDGYVLSKIGGKCVKVEMCADYADCGANQTFVECTHRCPQVMCPKSDLTILCKPPRDCPGGCGCKPYYRYNAGGDCIKASDCPAVECTRPNEEWTSCHLPSDWENCDERYNSPPFVLDDPNDCTPKCVCKKGFWRNYSNKCVPAEDCPSVCKDPNASWKDCMDACPATCQNSKPACVNKKCSAGCQCNDGYVLSKIGGKCVKVETCADYADCGANQTFVECTFRCPQVMCPESDLTILCKPPRDCPGGCGCKPYYRYNADGDCIKASDCPPVECTRPNEEWTSCHQPSDWENCVERNNSPPIVPDDPNDCTLKCKCKKGFWRNFSNECVPENECPPII